MSYFRVQGYSPEALLDGEQISISYNDDSAKAGKSVCDSLEELAEYLVQTGIPFEFEWHVVELDGTLSDDTDEDEALGARLIHPTKIIAVTTFEDELAELIDQAADELLGV